MGNQNGAISEEEAKGAYNFVDNVLTSDVKIRILDCLLRNDSMRNMHIAEAVDCSAAAVTDIDSQLSDLCLLYDDESSGLTLTPAGESVVEPLMESMRKINVVNRLRPFLNEVSDYGDARVEMIVHALEDAELDDQDINAAPPVKGYNSLIEEADVVKELVPFRLNEGPAFLDQFKSNDLSGTFIIDSSIVPDIMDVDKSEKTLNNLWKAGAGMKEAEGLPGFNITLFKGGGKGGEDVVMLIARGNEEYKIVKSHNEEVRDWAKEIFDSYENRSTKIFGDE